MSSHESPQKPTTSFLGALSSVTNTNSNPKKKGKPTAIKNSKSKSKKKGTKATNSSPKKNRLHRWSKKSKSAPELSASNLVPLEPVPEETFQASEDLKKGKSDEDLLGNGSSREEDRRTIHDESGDPRLPPPSSILSSKKSSRKSISRSGSSTGSKNLLPLTSYKTTFSKSYPRIKRQSRDYGKMCFGTKKEFAEGGVKETENDKKRHRNDKKAEMSSLGLDTVKMVRATKKEKQKEREHHDEEVKPEKETQRVKLEPRIETSNGVFGNPGDYTINRDNTSFGIFAAPRHFQIHQPRNGHHHKGMSTSRDIVGGSSIRGNISSGRDYSGGGGSSGGWTSSGDGGGSSSRGGASSSGK